MGGGQGSWERVGVGSARRKRQEASHPTKPEAHQLLPCAVSKGPQGQKGAWLPGAHLGDGDWVYRVWDREPALFLLDQPEPQTEGNVWGRVLWQRGR